MLKIDYYLKRKKRGEEWEDESDRKGDSRAVKGSFVRERRSIGWYTESVVATHAGAAAPCLSLSL